MVKRYLLDVWLKEKSRQGKQVSCDEHYWCNEITQKSTDNSTLYKNTSMKLHRNHTHIQTSMKLHRNHTHIQTSMKLHRHHTNKITLHKRPSMKLHRHHTDNITLNKNINSQVFHTHFKHVLAHTRTHTHTHTHTQILWHLLDRPPKGNLCCFL